MYCIMFIPPINCRVTLAFTSESPVLTLNAYEEQLSSYRFCICNERLRLCIELLVFIEIVQ